MLSPTSMVTEATNRRSHMVRLRRCRISLRKRNWCFIGARQRWCTWQKRVAELEDVKRGQMMATVVLKRTWQVGEPLAIGGFGRVLEAEADDGSAAVVKLVPKAPGASRELLFEELSGLPNIVPILDSGEWNDYYVLVMPLAEKSLRRHIEETGGRLVVSEAVAVLVDVAESLASLKAGVVHRDLKPENILLYEGHWCLADFGIARYAEATKIGK